jgi:hypothetical protein
MDDPRALWERLAATLRKDTRVDAPGGKGFGSKGLKVKRKLFAFLSSRAQLVLKLPKERVDALAAAGKGEHYDPGHGRLMKEWVALEVAQKASWTRLAREALDHASR